MTPFRFEERRIHGLYGLKTTLFFSTNIESGRRQFLVSCRSFSDSKTVSVVLCGYVMFSGNKEISLLLISETGCSVCESAAVIGDIVWENIYPSTTDLSRLVGCFI